jgi:probable F420-dependent oxidoreductase
MSTTNPHTDLGRIGIWSASARFAGPDKGIAAAQELEQLGFRTLWIPGGIDAGVLGDLDRLLDATSTLKFATGIINIWKHAPADLAAWWQGQSRERQERMLLGLGVSHGPIIGDAWGKPLQMMREFLNGLDRAGMPREPLCLAALGPKMLRLSAERTAGAHPYMVSTRHTAFARTTMGPGALLATEQGVVLTNDPSQGRDWARTAVSHYAQLPNYANNWRRDGFTDEEIGSLSDRLVDALIVVGDLEAIRTRVDEHFAAGADHVCLQVIGEGGLGRDVDAERPVWRELAKLL